MKAFIVHPHSWPSLREKVWPMYERALKFCAEDWNASAAEQMFLTGQHILYVVFTADGELDAVAQGLFVNYPLQTTFLVVLAAGHLKHYSFDTFCKLVRAGGATSLEAWCRPSMVRFLRRYGFTTHYTVVRKTL